MHSNALMSGYPMTEEMLAISSPHHPEHNPRMTAANIGQIGSPMIPFSQMLNSTNYASQSIDGSQTSKMPSQGSQFMKPNLRPSNSSIRGISTKRSRPVLNERESTTKLTELPIYKLLKVFKLQQYSKKMDDMGYGHDVYKLALLTPAQRDDFVELLKVMPGHKAKIAGFFAVIDDIYPRNKVMEQIQAATPGRFGKGTNKRITSAKRTRYHLGPQKTLLQKYEKLDSKTKASFNANFL